MSGHSEQAVARRDPRALVEQGFDKKGLVRMKPSLAFFFFFCNHRMNILIDTFCLCMPVCHLIIILDLKGPLNITYRYDMICITQRSDNPAFNRSPCPASPRAKGSLLAGATTSTTE